LIFIRQHMLYMMVEAWRTGLNTPRQPTCGLKRPRNAQHGRLGQSMLKRDFSPQLFPLPMITPEEAASAIREMLVLALLNHREGILNTVNPEGRPHASWMGTVTTPDFVHLITLTGIHTDKVANIRVNPKVEWMFTAPDHKTIIYFEGSAEILMDEELKNRYFMLVPAESRGFFMKYYRNGGEWCVIRTHIDSAVYCAPDAYTKIRLPGHQIRVNPVVPV
jgi:general stress protein 26